MEVNVPVPEAQIFVEIDQDGEVRYTQGDTETTEGEGGQAEGGSEDPKTDKEKEAALVANRVVHVIPVEKANGCIEYMVIRLLMGENGESEMHLDRVEAVDPKPGANMPLNPFEVEGMFLDRDVQDAREIVAAFLPKKQPEENPKTENPKKENAPADGEGSREKGGGGGSRMDA